MDCFYAAVHMRDDPSLAGKPVVIGGSPAGRGVVAAASYEVRRYGVHSAMPAAQAVRRCPHAVFIRPDFPRYRRESQAIFAIFRDFTPIVQPASLDEAYLDVTAHLAPWGSATAVAREIRRRVREERGLTVSVGVGPNRLVAKIASDFDKPDGLTVVPPHKVQDFLDPLPVRRILGVGPATERALHGMGIETIADLRARSREELEARFGRHGAGLYRYSRGIDERPVRTERVRKSLGHERTYPRDLATLEQMDAELERLSQMVAGGLRKKELLARTLTVKVRYADFTTLTRARTLPAGVDDPATIAAVAKELLRATDAGRRPVRLLGVTGSGFDRDGPEQLWLFDVG
ncbi:MAG: DNA polymerase IV [Acidobacteria bacterium]|nr:MAG: DNA polymerase IV [Acidobacteriota bacterium]